MLSRKKGICQIVTLGHNYSGGSNSVCSKFKPIPLNNFCIFSLFFLKYCVEEEYSKSHKKKTVFVSLCKVRWNLLYVAIS